MGSQPLGEARRRSESVFGASRRMEPKAGSQYDCVKLAQAGVFVPRTDTAGDYDQ